MALKDFAFKLLNKDNYAREGVIETHRGNIRKCRNNIKQRNRRYFIRLRSRFKRKALGNVIYAPGFI